MARESRGTVGGVEGRDEAEGGCGQHSEGGGEGRHCAVLRELVVGWLSCYGCRLSRVNPLLLFVSLRWGDEGRRQLGDA